MIKSVLLAVDFTDHSKLTLQSAIKFCQEGNCKLSLIHVIKNINTISESEQNQLNRKIDDLADLVQSHNIEVSHVKVVGGNVEENVVFFSESIQADAILLGSGNFHNHKKHRLGKQAEAILRLSSIPVIITKDSPINFNGKIACPIDLTIESEKVIKAAITYSKQSNSELVIIHAIEAPAYGFLGSSLNFLNSNQEYLNSKTKEINEFLKQFDLKGINWSIKLLNGTPAIEVTNYIKSQTFSMTIIGTASRTGVSRFILGSVAETVIRNIDTPCLVIKEKDNFGDIIIL